MAAVGEAGDIYPVPVDRISPGQDLEQGVHQGQIAVVVRAGETLPSAHAAAIGARQALRVRHGCLGPVLVERDLPGEIAGPVAEAVEHQHQRRDPPFGTGSREHVHSPHTVRDRDFEDLRRDRGDARSVEGLGKTNADDRALAHGHVSAGLLKHVDRGRDDVRVGRHPGARRHHRRGRGRGPAGRPGRRP